jgi:hypothetical protein
MYEYADKFKTNLKMKKTLIDQERGQQINFTPKILSSKASKMSMENAKIKGKQQTDIFSRKNQVSKLNKYKNKHVSMTI